MAKVLFKFENGSIASATAILFTRAANYLAAGSRNWLAVGLNKMVGYKGPLLLADVEGGKQMMPAAEGYASLGTSTTAGLGSVFRVLTALFFIGAGAVRYNGLTTGAVATSTLSLRLLENGLYNGTTLQAGLAQPSAPTVFTRTAGAGFTGTLLIPGTRAIVVWRIRSSTGAISTASLPSNVVLTATGQTLVITFPLVDSNGQDRWGIGTSKSGFGEFGPFIELIEIPESDISVVTHTDGAITATDQTLTSATGTFVAGDVGKAIVVNGAGTAGADHETTIASFTSATSVELTVAAVTTVSGATYRYGGIVDGISRSVEMEWTDGELAGHDFAPIDDFPPPPAVFGGTLNDTGFLDGAYGDQGAGVPAATLGATIVVSLPLKFESWPPDQQIYAPQPATAISSRAADGYAYRAGPSTLGALVYTGGFPAISFQLRWPNSGCLSPHNMVIAEGGRLYIWTSQHGLARIGEGDEPETEFAIPIWDEVASWNAAEVVLGWGESEQQVCACHRKEIKPFNSQLTRWGAMCDLTGKIRGNIVSAVTAVGGELYLCCNNVRTVSDLTTTNADATVTSPTAAFTADDVGKTVILTQNPLDGVGTLTTTILSFTSATEVELAANVTWTAGANKTTIAIDTTLRLYRFNAGTGMVSEAYTPWIGTEDESDNVFGVGGAIVVDNIANPVVLRLLKNGKRTNIEREWQIYLPESGDHSQDLGTQRPDLTNASSHALYVRVTGTGGQVELDHLYSDRESDQMVIAR